MLYSIGLVLNSYFFLFVCACFVLPSFQIKSYASSVSFLQILHFGWKFFMSYTFFSFFSGNNWGYTLGSVKVWCMFDTH